MGKRAPSNGRRAELLLRVKGPGPMDNTPKNRAQRRQAERVLKRMRGKPGGA